MATSTDNKLNQLVINRMTKTVYDSQTTLNNGEIYLVNPEFTGNKLLVTNASGEIEEASASIADIPAVINNTISTSTTDALSANMGREMQDQIDNLKARGRFLSLWNCATGLPTTNPTESPYTYKAGDYYIVSNVASSGSNYKPNGASYTTGVASTTVETDTNVAKDDMYIYDGTNWILQYNTGKTVSFSQIAGQPTDNTNLATALSSKVDDVQVNGTSVVTSGVANIPKASNLTPGVVQTNGSYGIEISANGYIATIPAAEATLVAKLNGRNVVVANNLDIAVREGLGNNNLTWTDAYKLSARKTIGAVGGVTVGGEDVVNSTTTLAELPYPVVFVNYED